VEYEGRVKKVAADVQRLAGWRRSLMILRAVWLSNRNRRLAAARSLCGKWTHMVSGYVRVQDVPKVEAALRQQFPSSMIVVEDPPPGEDVPVSLSPPRAAGPLRLLVEMFGLPSYQGFDPSPFLVVNFYLFFGICFSDVGYGLLLVLTSAYLARRTRYYRGVNLLARILFFGGCSTILFGALLGSWFGDLYTPQYLGEGNALQWIQQRLVVLDPVAKTVNALVIALFIGMCNQFYGILLKMYGALRYKDWMTAISDGLFWLISLPGFVILVSALFVELPPLLFRIGLGLFALGSLGLVLTQGRDVKNPLGRLLTGVVSLYGILGSYGYTAFIGDTLSYCRLLALGLTTSIVAQSVNMLAGMVRGTPVLGALLFLAVLVVGHAFNFLISLLGAFIHSMRLIFVEFFGRFYEGGARPFQPLGFDSPLCVLKRSAGRT